MNDTDQAAHSLLSLATAQAASTTTAETTAAIRDPPGYTIQVLSAITKRVIPYGFSAQNLRNANYPEDVCKCVDKIEQLMPSPYLFQNPPRYKLERFSNWNNFMICGPRVLCTHCNAYFAIRKNRTIRKHDCGYYKIQHDLAKARHLIRKMR
jgi:hypothetical protein